VLETSFDADEVPFVEYFQMRTTDCLGWEPCLSSVERLSKGHWVEVDVVQASSSIGALDVSDLDLGPLSKPQTGKHGYAMLKRLELEHS